MLRMKHFSFPLASLGLLLAGSVAAQNLTNTSGSLIAVQPRAVLYVGSGLLNQGKLLNQGTLRVDGPLTNQANLDLTSGTLEARGDVNNTGGTVSALPSTVFFTGATDQLLTPNGMQLDHVIVNQASPSLWLRLAGDLQVNGFVRLQNSSIDTRSAAPGSTLSTLRLTSEAQLLGEATGRYVVGRTEITRLFQPGVGGAVDFGHGAMLDPSGNDLGTVVITRAAGLLTADMSYGQNVGGTSKGIDRIWTVQASQPPTSPVQLSLSWLPDNDNGMSDFSQARVWQQSATGQLWATAGPVANANGTRSITSSPTVLNHFTVSNAVNPLPVTLVDFGAKNEGATAVRLNWATASELNNRDFTVERSVTGASFAAVGTVAGAGTSTTSHNYTLLDKSLPAGATLLYYRLRQNDVNGTFSYSPVRTVALSPQAAGFVIFPTKVPAGEPAQYLYTGPNEPGTLEILNSLGQRLGTVALDGRATGTVPLVNLASGGYLVRYTGPAGRFTTRLVVE
jgi:hypothetical protein